MVLQEILSGASCQRHETDRGDTLIPTILLCEQCAVRGKVHRDDR